MDSNHCSSPPAKRARFNSPQRELELHHPQPDMIPCGLGAAKQSILQDQNAIKSEISEYRRSIRHMRDLALSVRARLSVEEPLSTDLHHVLSFDTDSECRILVAGQTGAGKSTLIRALLDADELVPSTEMGNACTAVPIDIRQNNKYPMHTYSVEFVYIKTEDWRKVINTILRMVQDSEEQDQDHADTQGPAAMFKAVYPKLSMEELMSLSVEEVLDIGNTRDLLDTCLVQHYEEEETLSEALKQKAAVSTHNVSEEWPLLQCVHIYMRHELLSHGVVLVDQPGVGDDDAARNSRAKENLHEFDVTCLVAPTARANNDSVFHGLIRELLHRQHFLDRTDRLVLACTQADRVDLRIAAKDLQGKSVDGSMLPVPKPRKPMTKEEKKIIYSARANYIRQKQFQNCVEELHKREIKADEAARKSQILASAQVGSRSNTFIPVFVVSASAYQEFHGRAEGTSMNTVQGVEESEIPALRRHLIQVALEKLRRRLRDEYNAGLNTLRSLKQALLGNTSPSSQDDGDVSEALYALRVCLNQLSNDFEQATDTSNADRESIFRQDFLDNLPKLRSTLITKCTQDMKVYSEPPRQGLYYMEYRTGCNKHGVHSGKRRSFDWNDEVAENIMMHTQQQLKTLLSADSTHTDDGKGVHQVLCRLHNDLLFVVDNLHQTYDIFARKTNVKESTRESVRIQFNGRKEELRAIISQAKEDTKSVYPVAFGSFKSVVQDLWVPAYDAASKCSGKGTMANMGKIINEAVEHSVVKHALQKLETRLGNESDAVAQKLENSLVRLCNSVKSDYEQASQQRGEPLISGSVKVQQDILREMEAMNFGSLGIDQVKVENMSDEE